jgi:hypothetical protein
MLHSIESTPDVTAPRCYVCGKPARWAIVIAGEDEPRIKEEACEVHARGHERLEPIGEVPTA